MSPLAKHDTQDSALDNPPYNIKASERSPPSDDINLLGPATVDLAILLCVTNSHICNRSAAAAAIVPLTAFVLGLSGDDIGYSYDALPETDLIFRIQAPATVTALMLVVVRATIKPVYDSHEDPSLLIFRWLAFVAEVLSSFIAGRCLRDRGYPSMTPKQSSQVHTQSYVVQGILNLNIYTSLIAFNNRIDVWVRNMVDQIFRDQPKASTTRVEWSCHCGRHIYDDYLELRPGALNELRVQLKGRSMNSHAGEGRSPHQQATALSKLVNGVAARLSNFTQSNASIDLEKLPSSEQRYENHVLQQSNKPQTETLSNYLLLLFPHRTYAVKVDQPTSHDIAGDRHFFERMKYCYKLASRGGKPLLSCRGLVAIKFVEFLLRRKSLANIIKDAVPPVEEKHNYTFNPMPLGYFPPIGSNEMLHYLEHPEDLEPDVSLFSRVPQKLREPLKIQNREDFAVGWGVQFVEGFSYLRMCALGFCSVVVATTLAIVWSVASQNVQTGVTVGTYALMVFTMGLGGLQLIFEN